jgi:cellulose synthase/poly-beta-1,6-N-acetylglucosamine synthase-like glycosyltransferase
MHPRAHQITKNYEYKPDDNRVPFNASVLIGNYNHSHFIRQLVYRLVYCQQVIPPNLEVVIADTGSDEQNQNMIVEMMREYSYVPGLEFTFVCKNMNKHRGKIPHFHAWSYCINAALAVIKHDIIYYCDSSILVHPRFFISLGTPHLDHDNIFIRTKTLNYSLEETKISMIGEFYKKPWHEIFALLEKKKYSLGRTAWSVKKKYLEAVGGADERFTHYATHDDDMILRMMQSGCVNTMADIPSIHRRHLDTDRDSTDGYNESILKENLRKKIIKVNVDRTEKVYDYVIRSCDL